MKKTYVKPEITVADSKLLLKIALCVLSEQNIESQCLSEDKTERTSLI